MIETCRQRDFVKVLNPLTRTVNKLLGDVEKGVDFVPLLRYTS